MLIRKYLSRTKVDNYNLMKICSFISSMFPFVVYIFLKYGNDRTYLIKNKFNNKILQYVINLATPRNIAISIIIITCISIVYVIYFFRVRINNNKRNSYLNIQIHGELVQDKTNTSNYLLANVLPIITLETDEMYKVIFLVILIILLGFMYIKNNLYYINPLYDLMKIKVYTAEVVVIKKNKVVDEIDKVIISTVNLYDFKNHTYSCVEGVDNIIINKNID